MVKQAPFTLAYALAFEAHLDAIDAKYHTLIQTTIEEQLRFEPETKTQNRKPLQRPLGWGARWELRLGPNNCFRVFYRVEAAEHRVRILAVGVKDRNRLLVGGKEVSP